MRWFLDPSLHQGPSSQGCGFSSSHVCVWEWTIKKAECWKIDALELWYWRRFLSSFDCKEIKRVNPKGNQFWIFIESTDVEAETPVLWPPDAKSWLIWKDPVAGKDWGQEEKGLFKWVTSSHEVAKVLEFQLQYQSFQWTPRTDLL